MMARFDCAPAVVTRDIALYRQLAAANLELDPSTKAYLLAPGFHPLFEHRLEQVMAALMQGDPYSIESVGGALLSCDYPALLNRPSLTILAAVSRAIRLRRLLKVRYHSAYSGEQERVIAPHALVDSGLRWHVRAYDQLRQRFIDLVLTRMLAVEVQNEAPDPQQQAECDQQWQHTITLQLVPHPKLPDPTIATLDYDMRDGMLLLTVRAANAGYLLRRWFVDCSANASMDDPACRLWLKNSQSIQGAQSMAMAPGYEEE
ncbi:WYL domain-containing protein [Chromobacterium piscinae]|uniref:WYL domain-containing protein n=1 Tax=Chromobacterium piscinae TaxID=686831 RepID=UPI001E3B6E8A|nr:WYL domain-containing protein [Chromobacterium piscinae]MCD5329923.1 WYL domain-containing protein [Chromobacterium piscinae]